MATRRPRLSGFVCLQCESRLFNSTANVHRRLPQLAASTLLPHGQRQVQTWAQRPSAPAAPTSSLTQPSTAYFHGGRALCRDKRSSNKDVMKTTDFFGDVDPADEKITDADAENIWNSLLSEDGEPTEEQVFGFIDELWPKDETAVSEATFNKHAKKLADGFTVAQLQGYIRKYRKPMTQETVFPWEVKRKPWVPYNYREDSYHATPVKSIGPGSSILLKGYLVPGMTNKDHVVIQLMRECWGLSIREIMERPGMLEIQVGDLEFALLSAGAETWVRDISTAYSTVTKTSTTTSRTSSRSHSRSEMRINRHIELHADNNSLVVFAPASTADAMLAVVDATLKRTKTREISLREVNPPHTGNNLTPEALKAVGALTGSYVRFGEGGEGGFSNDILVSWVAHQNTNHDLEDTGDVVYRLLLRAFAPSTLPDGRYTTLLDYVSEGMAPKNSISKRIPDKELLLAETDEAIREAWSWEHRDGKWARLIHSFPLDASSARQAVAVLPSAPRKRAMPMELTLPPPGTSNRNNKSDKNNNMANKVNEVNETSDPEPEQTPEKWYESLKTSTVSTFGRVIHYAPSSNSGQLLYDIRQIRREFLDRFSSLRRILSPVVPPLLTFSSIADKPIPGQLTPEPEQTQTDGENEEGVEGTTATTMPTAQPQSQSTSPTAPTLLLYRSLVLHFRADPKSELAKRTPPLEVVINARAGKKLSAHASIKSLRFLTATHVCDTLFTMQPVDVRTTQKQFYELKPKDIQAAVEDGSLHIEPLLTFLEKSELHLDRIEGDAILGTIPRLQKLAIPAQILFPESQLESQPETQSELDAEGQQAQIQMASLDYVFVSLEVRHTVATAFEGWTATLTNVEAGRGAGRWTELSLEAFPGPIKEGHVRHPSFEPTKDNFRQAVGNMVHGDRVQWLMRHRQVD